MLIRFDPFRELDRVSQELWGATAAGTAPARIPFDAVRRGDQVELSFDLPGVAPDEVQVEVEKNVLTITAERAVDTERREGEEVLVRERRSGRFVRQLSLGDNLDADRLEADLADGVLRVTVPVAEQAKARKVEVSVGSSSRAIEADLSHN